MKAVRHPPDAVLRAYGDLLNEVFMFLRGMSRTQAINCEELFDLADAMHNIAGIIVDYGEWTDDKKYRKLYLEPFDEKWGSKSFRLVDYLDARLQAHLRS